MGETEKILLDLMMKEQQEKKEREELESAKRLYDMMGKDYHPIPVKEETVDEAIEMLKKINS